jgi:transposase-like protein
VGGYVPTLKVVQGGEESDGGTAGFRSLIDEIVRDGPRKMLAAALQAEVPAYVKQFADQVDDADVLLEFCHYPAEHWIHLRTTNPIESTFATVRLRIKVTKGPGSRA